MIMGKGEEEELWGNKENNDYGERRRRMIMGMRRIMITGKGVEEWLWEKEKDNIMGKGEEEELWGK